MKTFKLRQSHVIPRPLEEVFDFASNAHNLEKIIPPDQGFRVQTPAPIEMKVGAIIEHRFRMHGLPMRWRSEITAWDPPFYFVDEQRKGPFHRFVHAHRFSEVEGGTLVEDEVEYSVLGGALVNRWFVRPDLERIFQARQTATERVLTAA